jgi:hypothetical protein
MSGTDAKICIVSLLGKSQMLQNQTKAWKLNTLIQKSYFKVCRTIYSFYLNQSILIPFKHSIKCDANSDNRLLTKILSNKLKTNEPLEDSDNKTDPKDVQTCF